MARSATSASTSRSRSAENRAGHRFQRAAEAADDGGDVGVGGVHRQDAAGTVHSDIARGFIRAEVNTYDELVAVDGSFGDLRARGQLRLEGKDYTVKDGEVCHFRFNVAK